MVKTSLELLREYVDLIKEAEEEDFDASEFSSDSNEDDSSNELAREGQQDKENYEEDNSLDNNSDVVQELASYIESNKEKQDEGIDLSHIINQFLKEKHYDLVPTNGLENTDGDV